MCSSQIDKFIAPASSAITSSHSDFIELFAWCGVPSKFTKPDTVKNPGG